ncbi:MAG: hypothetical protein JXA95_10800 [Spirochaetales bacterium]|nr:hypothetical protein [Spirochaetales bacterium]
MDKLNRSYWTPLRLLFVVLGLATYVLMHNHYRVEYIDDPWSLSYAYNLVEKGEVYDTLFGYLDGEGGTALFSRTYAYVYGAFLHIFGWTRGNGYLLSTLLMGGAATVWYFLWREWGFPKEKALDFVLIMLLFDPYFGNAHKMRVDNIGFLIASLSLYLFLKRKYFFSGLLLLIAFENHPMGAIAFFYILAHLFHIRKEMAENPPLYAKGALIFILGCTAGIGYYLALHLPYLREGLSEMGSRASGHSFLNYFFLNRMAWRHLPELGLIFLCLGLFFFKKEYRVYSVLIPLMIASLVTSFLLHRGNMHYMIYFYPPFLMVIVSVFHDIRWEKLLLAGFLLFQLPQYGYLYYTQRDYDHRAFMNGLTEVLSLTEEDDTLIYGMFNGWYAFLESNYHCYGYFGRAGLDSSALPDHFYVIEDDIYFEEGYDRDLDQFVADNEQLTGQVYSITILGEVPFYGSLKAVVKEYLRTTQ